MSKVAVLMTAGLTDRIGGLEKALEENKPEDITIFWENSCDYKNVSFSDYFDTEINHIDIKIPLETLKQIWWEHKYDNFEHLNKYEKLYPSTGGVCGSKYLAKRKIFFNKHLFFKKSNKIVTNKDFIGVHFRWYCPLRKDENYFINMIESFKKIYDPQKNYFITTDSLRIQQHCSRFSNVRFLEKNFGKSGFIDRSSNDTENTIDDIGNLGNCETIYRTKGGFAYLAAAQSQTSPIVLQLPLKEEYLK